MDPIQRALATVTLVLAMTGLGACATVPGVAPPQEGVTLPFMSMEEGAERSWEVGHADSAQGLAITEFVRPDEMVEDWTELLTMTRIDKAVGGTVDSLVSAFEEESTARCPGSTFTTHERLEDGVLFEASLVNCEAGPAEEMVGRFLDGESNFYLVQYAVRKPLEMSMERRTEWLGNLREVSLISIP